MKEKDELKDLAKRRKVVTLLRFIGIAATIIGIGLKLYDFYANKELRHYFENANCITSLTSDEQDMILSAFDIVIPKEETDAFVSAFGKSKDYIYFVEFDSVKNNQNFYASNIHRIEENGISGRSVNETTNDNGEFYLTYAENIFPRDNSEKQRIVDLYSALSSR